MATRTKTLPEPSLERVRAALTGIGGDIRTGGRDLYGDLTAFVRAARKDTVKLGKALRGDAEQLARAAASPAPAKLAPAPPKPRRKPAARKRATTP